MTLNPDEHDLFEILAQKRRFIEIPSLSAFPELLQGFTTRFGGVSSGEYASLNLNFNRPDPRSNVLENYKLLGQSLGVPLHDMVLSFQVHDKKVLTVSKDNAGMGLIHERSFRDVDGLATRDKGLMLVTLYADCVPLYFYDPVKKVIALSHSGWKGTLLDIGGETVRVLKEDHECDPQDIYVAIGPHIKACCFEVDTDVARQFHDTFEWALEHSTHRPDGKWVLNLEGIITQCLANQGVPADHISGSGICTKCHKDIFFSHRGGGGKTGTGAAFMMIRG